jgi:predicted lysophospholipase L1 biosynthesis ABC-type transport system permease subunit
VAVVNESFVTRFSGDRQAIGRRLYLGTQPLTIVGVVNDLVVRDVQEERQDGIYVSMRQLRPYGFRAVVRTAGPPLQSVPELRAALARVDPDMPVFEVMTLYEAVYRDKRALDVLSLMFLAFGTGALLLTAIGLTGMVSLMVTTRLHEMGVRIALGASRARVAGLILRQGLWQVAAGLAVGTGLALVLTRLFASALEGIRPADGPMIAGLVASVAAMSAAALAGPVRRAIRVDVARALRLE